MQFEWHEAKNERNQQKHGISFELTQEVFDDPYLLSWLDRSSTQEERWITLGCIDHTLILTLIHTDRSPEHENIIRIISARKATQKERRCYLDHYCQATQS